MTGRQRWAPRTIRRATNTFAVLCLVTLFSLPTLADEPAIDLNKANVEDLDSLPGIGLKKAQAIIEYRELNGEFAHPVDLIQVKGIGNSTYMKFCRRIKVGKIPGCNAKGEISQPPMEVVEAAGDTRLNINAATATELQMLPGVGAKRAESIVSDREQNGAYVTPADLQRIKGIGGKTYEKMEPFIRTTFDPNTASKVELEAVGALTSEQVGALLRHRKGKKRAFRKLSDLEKVPGIDRAAVAKLKPFVEFW